MTTTTTRALDIADGLITATGRIRRALRRSDETAMTVSSTEPTAVAEWNLSLSQEAVLGHLIRGGAKSTADLARLEGVRPQSMGVTVTALEDLGLVAKSPDPTDARRSVVDITDAGRTDRDRARAQRAGILAARLDERLTVDDLACLERALTLIDAVVDR